MPKWIVWDWNGTLLDDVRASVDALNVVLREHHRPPLSQEEYVGQFLFPVKEFYRGLGVEASGFDWDALAESFHLRLLLSHHTRLQQHAETVLKVCQQAGYRQVVLSALEHGLLEDQLERWQVRNYFDQIVGSDNFDGAAKDRAAQQLHVNGDVVMIGDTVHDAEVAAKMGWRILLVACGHQNRQRLIQTGAPVLDALSDIPEWLLVQDAHS